MSAYFYFGSLAFTRFKSHYEVIKHYTDLVNDRKKAGKNNQATLS